MAKIKLYRGLKDIRPSRIKHNLIDDDGIWGKGTYLSEDRDTAQWYAFKQMDFYGLLVTYEANPQPLKLVCGVDFKGDHPTHNHLNLTAAGRKKLKQKEKVIDRSSVLEIAMNLGFDSVEISGEHTEPMIVISKSVKIKAVKYDYLNIFEEECAFKASEISAIEDRIKKDLLRYRAEYKALSAKYDF